MTALLDSLPIADAPRDARRLGAGATPGLRAWAMPDRAAGDRGASSRDEPDLQTEPVDPLVGAAWDRETQAFPEANFFHSSAWARVLQTSYGHRPCYFRLRRAGETVALVPVMEIRSRFTGIRGVSLPFSDACGPLVAPTEDPASVTAHLLALARRRGWKYLELRGIGVPAAVPPSLRFFGHRLDLTPGIDQLWTNCSGAARRGVNRARAAGLAARIARDTAAVDAFYGLHLRTRRRHGLPPQPRSFFRHLQREVLAPGKGFVVLVGDGQEPVAAALFVESSDTVLYKFGASDPRALASRPNNLAIWAGIEAAAARHRTTLDFGRTSLQNDGLRRFKRGWGTTESPLAYARYHLASGQWIGQGDATSGVHTHVFRRLPLFANRIAGTLLYPHLS
ncbi:hypothetical protein BH23VER1_BH23VER1_36610 [soil metagenome]